MPKFADVIYYFGFRYVLESTDKDKAVYRADDDNYSVGKIRITVKDYDYYVQNGNIERSER